MELATNNLAHMLESRECFDKSVADLVQDADPSFAVMLVGLDRFKAVNETL